MHRRKAIFDRIRIEHLDFNGTLSALKRLCASIKRERGVTAEDVNPPRFGGHRAGQVAHVDFGAVGKLWDPAQKRLRTAYVFVMVLGHSRHQFAQLVFDQKIETWLALHVDAFAHFAIR